MTDEHDELEPYAICECGRVFDTEGDYNYHIEFCDDYQYEKAQSDYNEWGYQRYNNHRGDRHDH